MIFGWTSTGGLTRIDSRTPVAGDECGQPVPVPLEERHVQACALVRRGDRGVRAVGISLTLPGSPFADRVTQHLNQGEAEERRDHEQNNGDQQTAEDKSGHTHSRSAIRRRRSAVKLEQLFTCSGPNTRGTVECVPADISVTGFDNVRLSEFCYPALTTVHIPRERIGHIICDRLLGDPSRRDSNDHDIVIDPEFVLRDSTGPAPARR